jgi:hypothetical protein
MNDEQLPPEGRLTDDQRARLRAGLLAAAGDDSGRSRPWLTPIAASAAVGLLIAGTALGGYALMNGDGREASPTGQGGASGSVTTSVTPTPTLSPTPTEAGTVPSTELTTAATGLPEPTYGPTGQESCDREVAIFLEDAVRTGEISYGDPGTTYLYADTQQWVVCDTWATVDGGPPTVTGPHPVDVAEPMSKDQLLISQNYSMQRQDGAEYFAAGLRSAHVAKIEYTFPTGDTVKAKMVGAMWSMVYLLPDPPNRVWSDPVHVVVTMADGTTQQYDLTDMDLCAQVNHGC